MSEGLQAEMTLQESCLDAMSHMSVEITALIDKTKELEDENAKLRKLVCAFDWCTENLDVPYGYDAFDCDRCPLKQTSAIKPECEVLMRELGIKEG